MAAETLPSTATDLEAPTVSRGKGIPRKEKPENPLPAAKAVAARVGALVTTTAATTRSLAFL